MQETDISIRLVTARGSMAWSRVKVLAVVVAVAGVVVARPAVASPECGTAALVAVNTSSGELDRWTIADPATHSFSAGSRVGTGWSGIRLMASDATTGSLYAIDSAGDMRIYRWTGSAYTGGSVVSRGWSTIDQLIPEGNGVLLARDDAGNLRWYRWLHDQFGEGWAAGSGAPIGHGWDVFSRLGSGGNGIVYGVRSGDGALLWYRYRNPLEPVASWEGPNTVGSGWGNFTQLSSIGGGYIFATTSDGILRQYHHLGYRTGIASWEVATGVAIGAGWTSYDRLTAGPTACGLLDPPVNLRAFSGGDGVALRWNPPAGTAPTSYHVYRDGVPLATVPAASAAAFVDTARFVDVHVTRGTGHVYQVDMTTGAGTTVTTSAVSATLPVSAPPVPTLMFQTPGGYAGQEALVRTTLQSWYPKFVSTLAGSSYTAPSTMTVVFGQNADDSPGVTSGTTMTFDLDTPGSLAGNVNTALTNPNFPGLVMHEATHVLQQYPPGPGWVAEGLAVWATHNILNDANTPVPVNTSYTAGYGPAAYLIRSASAWYGRPGLPHDLNVQAHRGAYADSFWVDQTGHTVTELWDRVVNPRAIP